MMIIRIVTDEEIKNAYNSYTNGLSVEKVSKLFNIPQTSLRRYFKRKGYSIRSLSEAEKIYSFNESYFDGDGSIWSHLNKKYGAKIPQYSIEFVGTDCILQYIMDNLLEHKIIKRLYNLNKRKKGQIVSNFKFGGNLQALNFCQYIYQDANTYLDRKHDKYIELTTIHSCL